MAFKKNAAPVKQAKNTAPKEAADPDMPAGAKEIDDGDVDEIVKLDVGDSLTGRYCGFKMTRSAFEGKKSTLHKFALATGASVGLFGSFSLDQKLAKVTHGAVVWVKYLGKEDLAEGNTMHVYKVAEVNGELPF